MNPLLHPAVQKYIKDHEDDDEKELLLRHKSILGLPARMIAEQIIGRRKAKLKLPEIYRCDNLLYPPSLNIEQCSSEATARFKSQLIKGASMVDLSGGFGIDSYYFSKVMDKLTYVEPDENLLEIAKHNHQQLGSTNISHIGSTAEAFINGCISTFDYCYIDPSRRKNNQKVFKLADCSPDVPTLLPLLQRNCKTIILKASPLLDIQQGIRDLQNVKGVFIVAVDNECKELLFLIEPGYHDLAKYITVDINHEGQIENQFEFSLSEEQNAEVHYSDPLTYLYEPFSSLMKAGAFKLLTRRFDLRKLAVNTHLYTSEKPNLSFPGKIFLVDALTKADAKSLRKLLPDRKANVLTRNYPLSAASLKQKLGVKDGGPNFLIGFSGKHKKFLALAHRIK